MYKVLSQPEEILQLAGRTLLVWPVEHFRDTAHGNHSIEIGMIWSQGSLFQWIPPPPTVLVNRYLTGALVKLRQQVVLLIDLANAHQKIIPPGMTSWYQRRASLRSISMVHRIPLGNGTVYERDLERLYS